jgi:NAD(P)-dependent dehydrogenase (short-subunit alcohol dehydrogenase family)
MFLSCKHVLPIMRKQRSGVIINISSTAALWSGNPFIAYNTSKAGVNGLTIAMVIECARYGIRVNAIMPGLINTPMSVDQPAREEGASRKQLAQDRDARVPLRSRMGEAWDVANAALFLASDEARFITGALLPVDGGQALKRG